MSIHELGLDGGLMAHLLDHFFVLSPMCFWIKPILESFHDVQDLLVNSVIDL